MDRRERLIEREHRVDRADLRRAEHLDPIDQDVHDRKHSDLVAAGDGDVDLIEAARREAVDHLAQRRPRAGQETHDSARDGPVVILTRKSR